LVVAVGAFIIFGGYYVWTGFLSFLEDQGNITAPSTRASNASATAEAAPRRPTLFYPATFTPLPSCQWFEVVVERANYRACPSEDGRECPRIDSMDIGTEVCVYSRAPENPEWYIVELNPEGAFRDTVFMHESVLEALNPTPTVTNTFAPLPTITPLPSPSLTPTLPVPPTETPDPATPTPTPGKITI
jgi:hypothetical protein